MLKLRLGIGDGYEYSRQEVADIFKKSLADIALVEQSALQHIAKGLGHKFEVSPSD